MVLGFLYMTSLCLWVRVAALSEPSPSEAAVDSQSVETATMISQEVGYDAGKQIHGRKRHLTVDLLGLVLRVLVTSASLPELTGAKLVFKRVHDTGNQVKRLHTIWMDGGYRGEEFMRWVMDMFRWIVEIVLRGCFKSFGGSNIMPSACIMPST